MNWPDHCNELLNLCAKWDSPLGPFLRPEDVRREMSQFAEKLGSEAAPYLAEFLKQQDRSFFEHLQPLSEFAELFLGRYPELVDGLLQCLEASGPVLVVELLGASRAAGVSETLIKVVDLKSANPELQIALFGALGELGDAHAWSFLRSLDEGAFAPDVRNEIEVAKRNVKARQESSLTESAVNKASKQPESER